MNGFRDFDEVGGRSREGEGEEGEGKKRKGGGEDRGLGDFGREIWS